MLKSGTLLGERYEIISKIGIGGMADVYKAKDRKLNRLVAAKVLKPEFREDTTFIKKFRTEAQAAAGLTHPNIVNVYDVGEDHGMHYIVMELIEGITLKDYISKKGRLSVKEATSIAIQVSMGLEAAHSHGIVHRDVKPQNIMINIDGKVKVTDFGIARAASSNTISSNVMGSVHYSSPEQVRGGYSDEKSDIYSLGIVLYEMLTGKVPFDGDTTVSIAIKHLQEKMIPASVYAQDLPFSLEQIINKCTQKSVDRRYQDMEEVIADLKHSLVDPEGDFVTINSVEEGGRTLVINDRDLTKIKNNSGKVTVLKEEPISKEEYMDEDFNEEEDSYVSSKGGKKSGGTGLKILGVVAGLAVLAGAGYLAADHFGLLEKKESTIAVPSDVGSEETPQETPQETPAAETTPATQEQSEKKLVTIPSITGMTEEEARAAVAGLAITLQLAGEESASQEVGTIVSQEPSAGSQVEENSVLSYKVSKGVEEQEKQEEQTQQEMPDYVYQLYEGSIQELLDMGMTVVVRREYGDYAEEDLILSTEPVAGEMLNKGDTVTVVVSDNDALYEEIEDEVFTPEETTSETTSQTTSQVDDGSTWVCTQRLDTPGTDYSGGPLKLELVQVVNGEKVTTVITENTVLQFPYQLNITGASGIAEGELHISEEIDGVYTELGYYPIKFKKQ